MFKWFNEQTESYCCICGCNIDDLSANPSVWGIELEYVNGMGDKRIYHRKCVAIAIDEYLKNKSKKKNGLSKK